MVWPRFVLSAVVLIITNLIVGSISLSLSVIALVMLAGVLVLALVVFSLLGLCVVMEKMNWLSPGWTDTKIERLKAWAGRTWRETPSWYRDQKRRIIQMLIETLKEKEVPGQHGVVKMLKSAVVGLLVLLAIVLLRYSFNLSIGWSIAVVAVGCVIVAIPVLYVKSRYPASGRTEDETAPFPEIVPSAVEVGAESDELIAALKELVALHRAGRLTELLDKGRTPVLNSLHPEAHGTDGVNDV